MLQKRGNIMFFDFIAMLYCKELQPFSDRNYGYAMLAVLHSAMSGDKEIGILELYEDLPNPIQKYPAYRTYLTQLQELQLIKLEPSTYKKNKYNVRLSPEIFDLINEINQRYSNITNEVTQL